MFPRWLKVQVFIPCQHVRILLRFSARAIARVAVVGRPQSGAKSGASAGWHDVSKVCKQRQQWYQCLLWASHLGHHACGGFGVPYPMQCSISQLLGPGCHSGLREQCQCPRWWSSAGVAWSTAQAVAWSATCGARDPLAARLRPSAGDSEPGRFQGQKSADAAAGGCSATCAKKAARGRSSFRGLARSSAHDWATSTAWA
mmetsp:Transcript_84062/g.146253  ORF Transcript_84062/g.146253 Transcript_84062/m.146253 type:complete len:200 (+) Transcript_84062:2-601(+)